MDGSKDLSIRQKLFLVFVVPTIILLALEGVARITNLPKQIEPSSEAIDLVMPTWMLSDLNQQVRNLNNTKKRKPEEVDWLNSFELGNGFRVRLIPKLKKTFTNTFSKIPGDPYNSYLVEANSFGFRGPEFSLKKAPNTIRVVVFGDSSSFGWGVSQQDIYSYLLPETLNRTFPDLQFEVLNFAIPGDSSEYGKLIFDRFVPLLKPDILIIGFGANDAKPVYISHTKQVEKFRRNNNLQSVSYWLNKSFLVKTVSVLLSSAKSKENIPHSLKRPAVSRKKFKKNLSHMAQAAEELGVKQSILLSLCTPGNYARIAKKLAENRGLEFFNGQKYLIHKIDSIADKELYPEYVEKMEQSYGNLLKQDKMFYITSDACHPNRLGHRMIADQLGKIISGIVNQ